MRFRSKSVKSHRYGVKTLLSLRQHDGSLHATSGLLVVTLPSPSHDRVLKRLEEPEITAAMTRLVHRSTHLQELKAVLAQFSQIHDALQQIRSHGCRLCSKFLLTQELRTQDPELALAEARQVARDMTINSRHLSDLVALETTLQQHLRSLRSDS